MLISSTPSGCGRVFLIKKQKIQSAGGDPEVMWLSASGGSGEKLIFRNKYFLPDIKPGEDLLYPRDTLPPGPSPQRGRVDLRFAAQHRGLVKPERIVLQQGQGRYALLPEKPGERVKIFIGVGDPGDEGNTGQHFDPSPGPFTIKDPEVLQDNAVGPAAVSPVGFVVMELKVEIDHVQGRIETVHKRIEVEKAACFKEHTDAPLLHFRRESGRELHEEGRLAARQGRAAAGIFKKRNVLLDLANDLLDRHVPSHDRERPRRTRLDAGAAECAAFSVNVMGIVARQRFPGADGRARVAPNAFFLVVGYLPLAPLALRVMAPDAGKRAPLEEDHGAYARTVVQGVSLDLEDQGPVL